MTETAFTVPGIPEPQGSLRAMLIGGRARIVSGGNDPAQKRHRAWRADVTQVAALTHRGEPFDGPVRVDLLFRFPRPAAARNRARPHVRPDLDKLCRSVLDSLTDAAVFADDGRVCDLVARKSYEDPEHPPGVDVRVRAI